MGFPQNKVELESQVLCAALRQSWHREDPVGAVTAARELYQLFPDLLPPLRASVDGEPVDYYQVLGIPPQAGQAASVAAFLRASKQFQRTQPVKEMRLEYNRILNAGFVLRKPRLRLSHDLVLVRHWLLEKGLIPEDGSLYLLTAEEEEKQEVQLLATTQPIVAEMPRLVVLLKEAQFIGPAEIQALAAQMNLDPDVPVERLVLNSGYVSQQEMNSLKLAEVLLDQGKISMAQFQVAIYDERTSGIRMAESLQVRGWLPVEAQAQFEDK